MRTDLDEAYRDATLTVETEITNHSGQARNYSLELALLDDAAQTVASLRLNGRAAGERASPTRVAPVLQLAEPREMDGRNAAFVQAAARIERRRRPDTIEVDQPQRGLP